MNRIPPELFQKADQMFIQGASIRQVMKECGIARETAHRIQKYGKAKDMEIAGLAWVNTGKDKSGKLTGYETQEYRWHWSKQHYSKNAERPPLEESLATCEKHLVSKLARLKQELAAIQRVQKILKEMPSTKI